jgi:pantetheine-phosphate adenylyltransferase
MHAVYPGTFDPPHLGHLDVISRAVRQFTPLTVTVFRNPNKTPLFTADERVEMLRQSVAHIPGVEVCAFDGLAVAFARTLGAKILVRGLRPVLDFDYEFQMALMNRRLAPDVETVFLLTAPEHSYIGSSLIKEVWAFGGDYRDLVPPAVAARLAARRPSAAD